VKHSMNVSQNLETKRGRNQRQRIVRADGLIDVRATATERRAALVEAIEKIDTFILTFDDMTSKTSQPSGSSQTAGGAGWRGVKEWVYMVLDVEKKPMSLTDIHREVCKMILDEGHTHAVTSSAVGIVLRNDKRFSRGQGHAGRGSRMWCLTRETGAA
jgi:hypothetical protein